MINLLRNKNKENRQVLQINIKDKYFRLRILNKNIIQKKTIKNRSKIFQSIMFSD
jgi:hypothetical protein